MHFSLGLLAVLAGAAAAAGNSTNYECDCRGCCCHDIPSDGKYYLTSFCDQETDCEVSCGDCNWAYATSAVRFGCNSQLRICKGENKCVTARVIDSGPGCWVENKAGRPIIDASFSICRYFTGGSDCGYEDKVSIIVRKVSAKAMMPDHLLGPCALTLEQANKERLPMCPSDEDTFFPQ